jgi:hypothetical protein
MGEKINCIMANENIRKPPYLLASATDPPIMPDNNLGITGMIIPNPITSIKSVKNINPIAAFLFFIQGNEYKSKRG